MRKNRKLPHVLKGRYQIMKCLILSNAEITEEECMLIQEEVYKEKNGRELPKKIKRIIGWKGICKLCVNHCEK